MKWLSCTRLFLIRSISVGKSLRLVGGATLILPFIFALLVLSTPVSASTFTVNTTMDNDGSHGANCATGSGACTLRDAIAQANASGGADTIYLPSGSYVTSSSDPVDSTSAFRIYSDMTIARTPNDTGTVEISGYLSRRIFSVGWSNTSFSFLLSYVTLDYGSTLSQGGAMYISSPANVTLDHVIIGGTQQAQGNTASKAGGGIFANGANLTISNSILSNNKVSTGEYDVNSQSQLGGGALYYYGGGSTVSLHVDSTTFSGNSVPMDALSNGGAIVTDTALVGIATSTISGNSGYEGGAIVHGIGTFTMVQSTVSGNNTHFGGAMYAYTPAGSSAANTAVTIIQSAIYNNNALGNCPTNIIGQTNTCGLGGGLQIENATLSVANSTISTNSAALYGGGIYNFTTSQLSLYNDTIANNSAAGGGSTGGGGVFSGGVIAFSNTMVANNIGYANVTANCGYTGSANNASYGHNLDSNNTSGPCFSGTNDLHADPKLGPLGDNGGIYLPHTFTHALLSGSPAIGAGDNTICAASPVSSVDQRGVSRPQPTGGFCDIGAYEAP